MPMSIKLCTDCGFWLGFSFGVAATYLLGVAIIVADKARRVLK